jgi:hypothetical protein
MSPETVFHPSGQGHDGLLKGKLLTWLESHLSLRTMAKWKMAETGPICAASSRRNLAPSAFATSSLDTLTCIPDFLVYSRQTLATHTKCMLPACQNFDQPESAVTLRAASICSALSSEKEFYCILRSGTTYNHSYSVDTSDVLSAAAGGMHTRAGDLLNNVRMSESMSVCANTLFQARC